MTNCEYTFDVPGPNEGCAEFAGPEEVSCTERATVLVRLRDSYPYPGESDIIKLHVCRKHVDDLMTDPAFIDVAVAS